jgi:DNA polymerase-1
VSEYDRSNVDGYLHPSIDLNHVASGRSNSSDPNLQNVPVRDEKSAKIIRGGFIPSPGNLLMEADFKAIEVRVMACYTHDPVLISYILDETKDMHTDQAARIFKLKQFEVTKQIRHIGKNDFVFPEFYGDWYETCAKSAWEDCDPLTTKSGMPVKEHLANKGITTLKSFKKHLEIVEKDFWSMLKITKRWRQTVVNDYLQKGYVDTFFGFRRNGYLEKNQIINTPVQGTAFHCLLWAYNRLTRLFKEMELVSKLIGQIHDSILSDVHPKEQIIVANLMRQVMEKDIAAKFDWIVVPLTVEIETTGIDMPWSTKKLLVTN